MIRVVLISILLFCNVLLAKEYSKKSIELLTLAQDLIKEGKNKSDILKLLKKSSNLGNDDATYTLGKFYLSKKSGYYYPIKAYNLFVDASQNNHAKSQFMIGKFFLYGKLIDKDYEKALYYFTLASKQKLREADCYIAYMYVRGLGVFPNFGRANAFAKNGVKKGYKMCLRVWKVYNLSSYPVDKGFRMGDYNKPIE